jgi:dTDP-4-amino-4,6-dideoxygalactose transaminase
LPSTFKFGGRRTTLQAAASAIPKSGVILGRRLKLATESIDCEGQDATVTNIAKTALSLPMHPHLPQGDVERVVQAVKSAIRG